MIAIVFVTLFVGNTQALIANLIGRVHAHTQRTVRYRRRWSISGQTRRERDNVSRTFEQAVATNDASASADKAKAQ